MTDHFALLGQPRRPWLNPEKLKERYQELARTEHPDQKGRSSLTPGRGSEAPPPFGEINEAYRVLSDPRLRLQHLLSLEGKTPEANAPLSPELMDLFTRTAPVFSEIDRLLEKLKSANNALSRSLLHQEILTVRQRADALLLEIGKRRDDSVRQVQEADKFWDDKAAGAIGTLAELGNRLGYLDRWIDQLRERQFQLENS